MSAAVLSVRDLRVRFGTKRGTAEVVNGLSYDLHAGETVALVGESGSGKSVSSLALTGLVPQPPGQVSGEVVFDGHDLVQASDAQLRAIRGNDIAMIFQDPMTSLNPVMTIGEQVAEGARLHLGLGEDAARDRAAELLDRVGIPSARERLDDYPHQFSGGMRQRVMIAIGLACQPKVLIADEPTTALDVTIQAQIVELIGELQREFESAVLWITHDLGVVAGIADRVMVMYAGRIVERAGVDDLYERPAHPYTDGLLGSLPVIGSERRDELVSIPGLPPDPTDLPPGCDFWPRCPYRLDERCRDERPPLREVASNGGGGTDGHAEGSAPHESACFYELPDETEADAAASA